MSTNRRGHTLRDELIKKRDFKVLTPTLGFDHELQGLIDSLHKRMVDDKCSRCSRNIDTEERRHIVSGYINENGSKGEMLVCITCTPDDGKWSWAPFYQVCG